MSLKVLIITVAYNPTIDVIKNLEVNYYPHMVIDNSECETIWLKDYCNNNEITYKWLGDNLGIAKAFNIGVDYALMNHFEYIVTMDQDSSLTMDLMRDMNDFIYNYEKTDNVAIFSPRHVNNLQDQNIDNKEISNGFHCMSSGNFVNLRICKELGGFDSLLFIDGVDIDYYLRALIFGYQVLTNQKSAMLHKMGNDSCVKWFWKYGFDVLNHNKIRKYYQARNFWYIYDKYKNEYPEVIFFKKIIRKMPISIIVFEDNKLAKLYYYLRGYIDYKRGKLGKIYF